MGSYESIVESAAEKLIEDERLRSNLTDDEANAVVDWAIAWLDGRASAAPDAESAGQVVQAELGRVRPAMQKINDLMVGGKMPALGRAVRALKLPKVQAAAGGAQDRLALIRTLTSLLTSNWEKK